LRAEIQGYVQKNLRFNFIANTIEASFFGLGIGLASYVTIIPLFVANLTESSAIIGLVSAMRFVGWQLPQVLTSNYVARLRRYKPMVLFMTFQERIPFFGLALVALAVPTLGKELALLLTFLLIIWQASGGGLTAVAWTSMTGKIIPAPLRGRFYGTLMSAASLMSSGGAVVSGAILGAIVAPNSFALIFVLAGISLTLISFGALTQVREPESAAAREKSHSAREFLRVLGSILRRDGNFNRFNAARMLATVAQVGFAFYTIYAVRRFNADAGTVGLMTAILLLTQVFANPLFGYLGDRYNHRLMFGLGAFLAGVSALIALFAPEVGWLYLVFALSGFANAGLQPTIYSITQEFGSEAERPYYIGLSSTMTAPATFFAPLIGGWLADSFSYAVTFGMAAVGGVLTLLVMLFAVRDPRKQSADIVALAAAPHVEPTT
jgi:MFS family permease